MSQYIIPSWEIFSFETYELVGIVVFIAKNYQNFVRFFCRYRRFCFVFSIRNIRYCRFQAKDRIGIVVLNIRKIRYRRFWTT